MHTKPVRRYRVPGYPAKLQVLSHPELLRKNLPPAWRTLSPVAGAAALFLSVNTTLCRGADKGAGAGALAVVAPIFEHGEGRGSTGCIVVSPPVFLSEEEALQVIREELGSRGIELTEQKRVIQKVNVPLTQQVEDKKGNISLRPREPGSRRPLFYRSQPEGEIPFQVDAVDPKRHVAVEFVSREDFSRMCGHDTLEPDGKTYLSSSKTYRVKDQAGFVAESVKKEGREKLYFGTFYDPVSHFDARGGNWREAQSSSQAESRRLLRLQVQDFVKWLQAQGAM